MIFSCQVLKIFLCILQNIVIQPSQATQMNKKKGTRLENYFPSEAYILSHFFM